MKARESGMPEEEMWQSFFDPDRVLTALGLTADIRNAVDFGCGYGTFALPAAKRIQGALFGFDIDSGMIKQCERRAKELDVSNIHRNRPVKAVWGVHMA